MSGEYVQYEMRCTREGCNQLVWDLANGQIHYGEEIAAAINKHNEWHWRKEGRFYWKCVDCGWVEFNRSLVCPNCATDGELAKGE